MYNSNINTFPENFVPVDLATNQTPQKPKPYGGWSDPRDHQLCMNLTNPNLKLEEIELT